MPISRETMRNRFIIRKYEHVVDYDAADSICVDQSEEMATLTEAIDALCSDCWDNVDVSGYKAESTLMLYPADWQQDFRTGEVTHTDIAITGATKNINRLYNLYVNHYGGKR